MVLSLTQAWRDATAQSTVPPVVLVRLSMDLRRVLTIVDGSQATNGDTITVRIGVTDHVLTAGTDFNFAGLSNQTIASNIANAWNAAENARATKTGITARSDGYFVFFIGGSLSSAFTLISSDTNFARETYSSVPDLVFEDGIARIRFSYVSGDTPLFGYPCCVTGLSSASAKIDPFTRKLTIGAVDVEFGDDGQAIRELAKFHRLYLARVQVLIGTQDLAEADFALMGTYVIHDVKPEKGRVVLQCNDFAEDGWKNQTIRGAWVARHPLQIISDILTTVFAPGTPNAVVDTATLAPELYADISHFNCSRYHDLLFGLDNAITDDASVIDEIEELLFMAGGSLIPSNTGLYRYNHFDFNKAISRTWEASPPGSASEGYDIDQVEVIDSVGQIINKVRVSFARRGAGSEELEPFELSDEFSRLTFGRRVEETFDLRWSNGYVNMQGGRAAGPTNNTTTLFGRLYHDSTYFDPLPYAGRQGFCGARYNRVANQWQLQDGASLGGATGRYCFLLLKPPGRLIDQPQSGGFESATEFVAIDQWEIANHDADHSNVGNVPAWNSLRARIAATGAQALTDLAFGDEAVVGRGGLGTTPPGAPAPDSGDFWQFEIGSGQGPVDQIGFTQAIDVTIPIAVAQRILRRFRFGAPEIRVRTTLEHLDLEIGDFVAINGDDIFIGHQRDGLTSAIVWEIVGKEVDILADSPGIVWDLVFVRDSTQPSQAYGFIPPVVSLTPVPVQPIDRRVYVRDPNTPGLRHVVATDQGQEVWHR